MKETEFRGEWITLDAHKRIHVPSNPNVGFIEGDGTGPDIWAAARPVFDAAVLKAYSGKRKIHWFELLAGERATKETGAPLPQETIELIRKSVVAIKGPLTTPVGTGIRSLNVALRQLLDLYACIRPVRYFSGLPSPVRHPEKVNMTIFRENTEDVYAGIEWASGSEEANKLTRFLLENFKVSLPDRRRYRDKADQSRRDQEARAARHRLRNRTGLSFRDSCPQGKYHEVHGRGFPQMGL